MDKEIMSAVEGIYNKRAELLVFGLTGRTGSGCSKVAEILKRPTFSLLDLKEPKSREFLDADERKYSIVFDYMKTDERWKPFTVIEISSLIFSFILENGCEKLLSYLTNLQSENNGRKLDIGDFDSVVQKLKSLEYMFVDMQSFSLSSIDLSNKKELTEEHKQYFLFYTEKLPQYKERFKSILNGYSCYEMRNNPLSSRSKVKFDLYIHLMQQLGNNIRSSLNPYDDTFLGRLPSVLTERIAQVISLIRFYNEKSGKHSTRICIDAIRNPFEAYYLKDRFSSFYLISINTEETTRRKRLGRFNKEEMDNIDKNEYPEKFQDPKDTFFHQNILSCLEASDIHIYNPDVDNSKYFDLTKELIKIIALVLHPGIITPTPIERCMQLAFTTKINSGCLSRQVGAVVTDKDFSIRSVGWNDVPRGQIACNLRDLCELCKNKDSETYSKYELCDKEFNAAVLSIKQLINDSNLGGRHFSYCFKDIYNGMSDDKNQVYTRSLHAEENAFLQIAKNGGQGVKGGYLFTTASPCELCAKKAYQLGISRIYYIDPYPGISKDHILSFGDKNNPETILFSGAIGKAYISLYAPRMSFKDEIELLTGINCKSVVNVRQAGRNNETTINDYEYFSYLVEFDIKARDVATCSRECTINFLRDGIKEIKKSMNWTGSSYDGIVLKENDGDISLVDTELVNSIYRYTIRFSNEKKQGENSHYIVQTNVRDEEHIMSPYIAHYVSNRTTKLILRVKCPKNLINEICEKTYADRQMKCLFETNTIVKKEEENYNIFEYAISNPNLFYTYLLEWKFEGNS